MMLLTAWSCVGVSLLYKTFCDDLGFFLLNPTENCFWHVWKFSDNFLRFIYLCSDTDCTGSRLYLKFITVNHLLSSQCWLGISFPWFKQVYMENRRKKYGVDTDEEKLKFQGCWVFFSAAAAVTKMFQARLLRLWFRCMGYGSMLILLSFSHYNRSMLGTTSTKTNSLSFCKFFLSRR